jgi:hypothetical protein
MDTLLFPFADYWWFYLGFTVFVLAMLALDLGVFHRKAHEVSFKEATVWSVVWAFQRRILLLRRLEISGRHRLDEIARISDRLHRRKIALG